MVTPANPAGAGTVFIGTPTIITLGTNTGLTYNFTTGFSGFGAGVVGTVLPIGLLNFEGQLKNNHVLLDWSTSSELNSKEFDVERSYDADNFIKAGTVTAAGNSSISRNYAFTDTDNPEENNYYRLRMVDLDGKYQYSKIILINRPADKLFKVLNNPFTSYIDILLGKPVTGNTQIRLLDVAGKELLRTTKASTGFNTLHIDLSQKNISAGVYLLELIFNNEKHIERVVKQ